MEDVHDSIQSIERNNERKKPGYDLVKITHEISPAKKAEREKEEKEDRIEAELLIFENTRNEREKIYRELNITELEIAHIEYAFEQLIRKDNMRHGFGMDEDRNVIVQEAFDRISVEVFGNGKWPVLSIRKFKEKFGFDKFSKFEVITHPLYGLLQGDRWDRKKWERADKNLEKYLDGELVDVAKQVISKLKENPSSLPCAYVYLMEIVQELEAMRTSPSKDTLRIYNMPRRAYLSEERRNAMYQLLEDYSGENIVVMDSYDEDTGRLNYKDVLFFQQYLPQNALVELQGGYLGGCLNAAWFSFEKAVRGKGRSDIELTIDFWPSTSFAGPTLDDLRHMKNSNNNFIGAPFITIPLGEIKTTEDVIGWIRSNSKFNVFWENATRPLNEKGLADFLKHSNQPF
ncbi:hypothetical protein HZC21_05330 [Candidatus Peregrinibacteria bacterium]|nr:hypothetical protein [Candidatus Peregrinibacteria bacterium]